MYRNRRTPGERIEELEKKKAIERKYYDAKDDINIINLILSPKRTDDNGLPYVWCSDFRRKRKDRKRVIERRDLILNFCTEIEQHFPGTDRNIFLPKVNSLLETYDRYAAKLSHRKNLSDACKQLLIEDFNNYSSPNIEDILKNLKSHETKELTERYTDPITMFFTEDALREDEKKYKFEDIDPDELVREFAKFEQEELNFNKSDHGI